MNWKKCKDMPRGMTCAQTVLISGKVYVGGGSTESFDDDYLIHEYSPADDRWSTLPPAPVFWFGMGKLNGQLVMVGGKTRQGIIRNIHVFEKLSQKWEESIPPMPTARRSPVVFSQPSCLTVVGGTDQCDNDLSDVEIFMPHTSQWHKASSAPSSLSLMTTTVIYNKCFLQLNKSLPALCVSASGNNNNWLLCHSPGDHRMELPS